MILAKTGTNWPNSEKIDKLQSVAESLYFC